MNIKYKNYVITEDRNCVKLCEIKENKKWEKYESDVIFPSTIERALLKIFEKEKARRKDTVSLSEYIKVIWEISQELKDFINKK